MPKRAPLSAGIICLAAMVGTAAHAEIEASLDLRLVQSDGRNSYIDGALGKLRYDNEDDGLQLGRARLAWRDAVAGNWHASVDLSAWSLDDHNLIDVTEAWLEWRPVPTSPWRSNVKIGAFYPPISLEHRAAGWSNPYTISSSAVNTWVGEELRTIGAAYEIEHLGIAGGGRFDVGVHAAVFGWNDPAGVIIAFRGFSLNDRQTPLFGRVGSHDPFERRNQRVIFHEIDDRPGYHAGAYLKSDAGLEIRALRYDNRGDPSVLQESIDDYAWDTAFSSVGVRYDSPSGVALIAQLLKGRTQATADPTYTWRYRAWFALVAKDLGRHRFAVRYDDFGSHQDENLSPGPWLRDEGDALTFGWTWAAREHVEIAAEWLRIDSNYNGRGRIGESPRAIEHLVQLAVRLSL